MYNGLSGLMAKTENKIPDTFAPLTACTATRTKPRFAARTLHQMTRKRGVPDE